jgi:hypothetical protein
MAANPLDAVKLTALMGLTGGRPDVVIGLIDGPVAIGHPALAAERVREVPGALSGVCRRASSAACLHGTFVAGAPARSRGPWRRARIPRHDGPDVVAWEGKSSCTSARARRMASWYRIPCCRAAVPASQRIAA